MPEREPLPSWADWSDQAEALGLRLRSGELKGPCPSCGGTDRFHIRRSGPDARVGCRGCIDGGGTGFGAVIRAVFPERFDTIGSPSISHTLRQTPKSPQPADTGPDPLVAQLWTRAVPPDPTPGRLYLALRFAWPPHGIGPNLPTTVRWLDVQAAPAKVPDARWFGLPDGAAGALVFAWKRSAGADPVAMSLEALDTAGRRIEPRWRRTFGTRAGTVFEARAPSSGTDPVHVAEGEVDALALALAPWCRAGGVYAAGGTSGMRTDPERFTGLSGGPVVLHADGKPQGAAAASYAKARIQATGRECRIERYAPRGEDGDPAAALAEWIGERAAIREFDGGATREEAVRGAWHDLLRGSNDDPDF